MRTSWRLQGPVIRRADARNGSSRWTSRGRTGKSAAARMPWRHRRGPNLLSARGRNRLRRQGRRRPGLADQPPAATGAYRSRSLSINLAMPPHGGPAKADTAQKALNETIKAAIAKGRGFSKPGSITPKRDLPVRARHRRPLTGQGDGRARTFWFDSGTTHACCLRERGIIRRRDGGSRSSTWKLLTSMRGWSQFHRFWNAVRTAVAWRLTSKLRTARLHR